MKANIYPHSSYFPAFVLYTVILHPYFSVTKQSSIHFPALIFLFYALKKHKRKLDIWKPLEYPRLRESIYIIAQDAGENTTNAGKYIPANFGYFCSPLLLTRLLVRSCHISPSLGVL